MNSIDDLIKKIEELYNNQKINEEIKNKLIEKIKEKYKEEKIGKSYKNIYIESISEKIEIIGREDLNKIIFDYGKENFDIEEKDNNLYLKSKIKSIGIKINIFGIVSNSETFGEKLKLYIPKKTNLYISTVSGDSEIKNLSGKLKIKSVSGDINIENIDGEIDLYTISGDLELKNVDGDFKLNSKSGDISLINVKDIGFIKTYSGDVNLKDCEVKKLYISSFSGDQTFYNLKINDTIEIKTISGDINIKTDTKDLVIISDTKTGDGTIVYEGKVTKITKGEIGFGSKERILNIKTLSGDFKIEID
jgi:DUF4097 and DUF4098 domain-containing protein YvlB